MIDIKLLSGVFRLAAKRHFISSDLCSHLSLQIAEDSEILDVACRANPKAFPPYLLMSAVHSLVLDNPECELARFFSTVSSQQVSTEDAFPVFKNFILTNRELIESIICTANVNKTVLKRSACLRALLIEAAQRNGWKQVHLVDIGCSAGLNLLMDQWRMSYGSMAAVGPEESSVHFSIDVRGGVPPCLELPKILSRTGIDLDRFDLENPAHERWLLGCLFPDQPEIFNLTKAALECLRGMPPRFVIGNAATELANVLHSIPGNEPVVVMHSMTLYQMKLEHKISVNLAMNEAAKCRPIVRIGMEIHGSQTALLLAGSLGTATQTLGAADDDASWIQWNCDGKEG